MELNTYLSMITLNANELKISIKRCRVIEWIKKETHWYTAKKRLILDVDTCQWKVGDGEKAYHTNECQKKARVVILIWEKLDFKTKTVTRHKERH